MFNQWYNAVGTQIWCPGYSVCYKTNVYLLRGK